MISVIYFSYADSDFTVSFRVVHSIWKKWKWAFFFKKRKKKTDSVSCYSSLIAHPQVPTVTWSSMFWHSCGGQIWFTKASTMLFGLSVSKSLGWISLFSLNSAHLQVFWYSERKQDSRHIQFIDQHWLICHRYACFDSDRRALLWPSLRVLPWLSFPVTYISHRTLLPRVWPLYLLLDDTPKDPGTLNSLPTDLENIFRTLR